MEFEVVDGLKAEVSEEYADEFHSFNKSLLDHFDASDQDVVVVASRLQQAIGKLSRSSKYMEVDLSDALMMPADVYAGLAFSLALE